jgi:glutaredoxin
MLLKILRKSLGMMVVFVDFVTRPTKIKRTEDEQSKIKKATNGLSLYQIYACPFCTRTRRVIYRLNLPIEYRSVQKDEFDQTHRETLLSEGGEVKVPCLRIDGSAGTKWLYESADIIAYLNQRFDPEINELSRA